MSRLAAKVFCRAARAKIGKVKWRKMTINDHESAVTKKQGIPADALLIYQAKPAGYHGIL
jgi:hypothetical protein